MSRKSSRNLSPVSIGWTDEQLDRREELLERQRQRENIKFKEQERRLRQELRNTAW